MKALVTGITGQDGYFLSKMLLKKGYEVHGVVRRSSQKALGSLEFLEERSAVNIHFGDVVDPMFMQELVRMTKPDELYHLAAQSFVSVSFDNPAFTYDVNMRGTLNVANAVLRFSPSTRVYDAGTSEMFGTPLMTPQNEDTPFCPQSPYAISKLAAYWTMRVYRDAYRLFASNGIFFNHESEIRGPEFVTRKISLAVARHSRGDNTPLVLGNLDARKDWGYAPDYVRAMWMILQHDRADDFVVGTGETHTVREFVQHAFGVLGMNVQWEGEGAGEVGLVDGKPSIEVSQSLFRPLEAEGYRADYSKIHRTLGWEPSTGFKDLVRIMVEHDLRNYEGSKKKSTTIVT